jgi:hypothetical protein
MVDADEKFYTPLANERFGLPLGILSPPFSASDVDGNTIVLESQLKEYKGIFLNFFRGSW